MKVERGSTVHYLMRDVVEAPPENKVRSPVNIPTTSESSEGPDFGSVPIGVVSGFRQRSSPNVAKSNFVFGRIPANVAKSVWSMLNRIDGCQKRDAPHAHEATRDNFRNRGSYEDILNT